MAAEKQFENKVKKYLEENGCWYVKYFANRNTKSGIPDLLACVNGYFVAIEVKTETGKPSPLQLHHQEKIRQSDGISIILYPDQFDEFKFLIEGLKNNDIVYMKNRQIIFDKFC